MVNVLFDTNILIDYLNGIIQAKNEIERYKDKAISVISWIEVMVGTNQQTNKKTQDWMDATFSIIPLDKAISIQSIKVRKNIKIKLPDAIIYASAKETGRLLISRNTKDFSIDDPMFRLPYEL